MCGEEKEEAAEAGMTRGVEWGAGHGEHGEVLVERRPLSCDYINGSRVRLCWRGAKSAALQTPRLGDWRLNSRARGKPQSQPQPQDPLIPAPGRAMGVCRVPCWVLL